MKYAQPGNGCEANVDNDSFQTIKVPTENKWETIKKNNVYVKYAQPGKGGEAKVGNDFIHIIKVTTENKWDTIE